MEGLAPGVGAARARQRQSKGRQRQSPQLAARNCRRAPAPPSHTGGGHCGRETVMALFEPMENRHDNWQSYDYNISTFR